MKKLTKVAFSELNDERVALIHKKHRGGGLNIPETARLNILMLKCRPYIAGIRRQAFKPALRHLKRDLALLKKRPVKTS
jgi:hypothetical protein